LILSFLDPAWKPDQKELILTGTILNVLGLLVQLAPTQADLLDGVCKGTSITESELEAAGAFQPSAQVTRKSLDRQGINTVGSTVL
jgi:hypothetical protein